MKLTHLVFLTFVWCFAPALGRAQNVPGADKAAAKEAKAAKKSEDVAEASPEKKEKSVYERKKTTSYKSSMRNAKVANKDKWFMRKQKLFTKVRKIVFGDPRKSCTHPQHGAYMQEQFGKKTGIKFPGK